jgi:hypothetical protein
LMTLAQQGPTGLVRLQRGLVKPFNPLLLIAVVAIPVLSTIGGLVIGRALTGTSAQALTPTAIAQSISLRTDIIDVVQQAIGFSGFLLPHLLRSVRQSQAAVVTGAAWGLWSIWWQGLVYFRGGSASVDPMTVALYGFAHIPLSIWCAALVIVTQGNFLLPIMLHIAQVVVHASFLHGDSASWKVSQSDAAAVFLASLLLAQLPLQWIRRRIPGSSRRHPHTASAHQQLAGDHGSQTAAEADAVRDREQIPSDSAGDADASSEAKPTPTQKSRPRRRQTGKQS